MTQVANGARLKYQGTWPNRTGSIPFISGGRTQVVQGVTAVLAQQYSLIVEATDYNSFASNIDINSNFDISLSLLVNNGLGYGSENDIVGIIGAAVQNVTGSPPIAGRIVTIQQPNNAVPVPTGAPNNPPTNLPTWLQFPSGVNQVGSDSQDATSSSSLFDFSSIFGFGNGSSSLADSFNNLFSNTELILAGLGVGAIVAVILITKPR